MRKLDLQIDKIRDEHTRDSFDRLQQQLSEHVFGGFRGRHMVIAFSGASVRRKVPHGLAFIPEDILVTALTVGAALQWHYEEFDRKNLVVTVDRACTLRCYVGTHSEEG